MIKKLVKTLIASVILISVYSIFSDVSLASTIEGTNIINAIAEVHVQGAIKKPGIYRIPEGTRLVDVLSKAGGLKKDAVLTDINLTTPVTDGSTIYIASKNDKEVATKVNLGTPPTEKTNSDNKQIGKKSKTDKKEISNKSNGLVNINTATVEELNALPGIGEKLAKNIVKYRNQHGRFKNISELNNVGGIGDKKFQKLKSKVTI